MAVAPIGGDEDIPVTDSVAAPCDQPPTTCFVPSYYIVRLL
jgi:hypothetical protein